MDLYQLSVCLFICNEATPVLSLMARPEGVRLLEFPL